jgi:phage terminase small subunit
MRGRKPDLKNVVPLTGNGVGDLEQRQAMVNRQVKGLMPRGLTKEERAEWRRVATMLAAPHIDRLKPHFVDVIKQFVRANLELNKLWDSMPEPGRRFYKPVKDGETSRNGAELLRPHPNVMQFNTTFSRWRQLVAMLGLSPQDERAMMPGQGDLFDAADQYFS